MSLVVVLSTTFMTAFLSSLHCLGMCGGLVLASCDGENKNKQNFSYQIGRLLSYLFLGLLAGIIGRNLSFNFADKNFNYFSLLLLTLFFGYFIFNILKTNSFDFKMPKFILGLQSFFMRKVFKINNNYLKTFLLGSFSILLPCGFLYGVVISLATFSNPFISILGMLSFWLGTMPAMFFAPNLINRIFQPLLQKYPRIVSICFASIILTSLSVRFFQIYNQVPGQSCH